MINKSLKVSKCSPVTALSILSGNTASGRSRPSYGSEHSLYTPSVRLAMWQAQGGADIRISSSQSPRERARARKRERGFVRNETR